MELSRPQQVRWVVDNVDIGTRRQARSLAIKYGVSIAEFIEVAVDWTAELLANGEAVPEGWHDA